MTKTHKTIAVDFDGTLADDSRVKYPDLGPPIPTMVERVRGWIQDGHTVKIFTARLAEKDRDKERDQVKRLTEWLDLINLTQKDGRPLVLTATKLPEFDEFWDDKAVGVIRNTGSTYFEAEHYRENWRTPPDVTGNGAQLELQFGGAEYEQFYSSDPNKLHQNVYEYRRMRGDYDTPATLEEKLSDLSADRQDRINSRAEALIKQQLTALGPVGQERVGDAGRCGGTLQGYHQEFQGLRSSPQPQTATLEREIEQGFKQNPRYVPVGIIGGSKGSEDYLNRKYQALLASQAQQASELSNQLRSDPEFKSLQTSIARSISEFSDLSDGFPSILNPDPREPYTR